MCEIIIRSILLTSTSRTHARTHGAQVPALLLTAFSKRLPGLRPRARSAGGFRCSARPPAAETIDAPVSSAYELQQAFQMNGFVRGSEQLVDLGERLAGAFSQEKTRARGRTHCAGVRQLIKEKSCSGSLQLPRDTVTMPGACWSGAERREVVLPEHSSGLALGLALFHTPTHDLVYLRSSYRSQETAAGSERSAQPARVVDRP